MSDSNIGEVGVKSIRIKGQKIENLPLGMGNEAKAQLPNVIAQERIRKIEGVNSKYPTLRIDYIDSRVKECRENITRIQKTMGEQSTMISEYRGHINMSRYREDEIAKWQTQLDDCDIDEARFNIEKKALLRRFPAYEISAMKQQIVQCEEAIKRCDEVIQTEHDSIAEFTEAKALCKQRDVELAALGAVAEG